MATAAMHHSRTDDGIVNTSKLFILADKDRRELLAREIRNNGRDVVAREQRKLYYESLARKTFYVFNDSVDMSGITNEPWRNRIRAANAAFRRTAINQILTSRQRCRETAACMIRKLPKELVIMILKQQALLIGPRNEYPAKTSLAVMLHDAAMSLFPIFKEPPTELFELALDVALATSSFRLYASLIVENHIAITSLRSSA
ncbi:hypothetical protein B0A48_02732 [Cryoendolithus antarcticus]|uniref:Uncharacterized protein n=1 Tax=Cryoendolithus antarcticus TaxID=1507870 RepID=A0A1V8TL35_9PEZI|nr:hypothetical protein B0A48_02732 [Cryoendolithus antarcticus]